MLSVAPQGGVTIGHKQDVKSADIPLPTSNNLHACCDSQRDAGLSSSFVFLCYFFDAAAHSRAGNSQKRQKTGCSGWGVLHLRERQKGHSQGVKLVLWEWMPHVGPGSYIDLLNFTTTTFGLNVEPAMKAGNDYIPHEKFEILTSCRLYVAVQAVDLFNSISLSTLLTTDSLYHSSHLPLPVHAPKRPPFYQ